LHVNKRIYLDCGEVFSFDRRSSQAMRMPELAKDVGLLAAVGGEELSWAVLNGIPLTPWAAPFHLQFR